MVLSPQERYDLSLAQIGLVLPNPALVIERVRVVQLPATDLRGEMVLSMAMRFASTYGERSSLRELKVSTLLNSEAFHIALGPPGRNHDEILVEAVPINPHLLVGGAFLTIDWRTGQVSINGSSNRLGAIPTQLVPLVDAVVGQIVRGYIQP